TAGDYGERGHQLTRPVLAGPALGLSTPRIGAGQGEENVMPRVSHHFVVDRSIEAVFAVVSTARFWPEWHPATRSVEGDTDHPARLFDRITEHATIAGVEGTGVWTVTEHAPPHHLAFEAELAVGHLRIAYAFTVVPDVGTRFQRDLDFPELGPKV